MYLTSSVHGIATFSVYAATRWAGSQYGALYIALIIGKAILLRVHATNVLDPFFKLLVHHLPLVQICRGANAGGATDNPARTQTWPHAYML